MSDETHDTTRGPSVLDRERAQDERLAHDALKRAGAQELHALFLRSETRYREMDDTLTKVIAHYVGKNERPRTEPSDTAIHAMERVARDALELAKLLIVAFTTKHGSPTSGAEGRDESGSLR